MQFVNDNMKYEEITAFEFLKEQGYLDIKYEPNGNRTPDFLLDNKIAIEVRRLNQHTSKSSSHRPLEELYFKLLPRLEKLFNEYDNNEHISSAFVCIEFGRPLKVNENLINHVKEQLDRHSKIMDESAKYDVCENLTLTIFPSTHRLERKFNFGSSMDIDSGGFVLSNIVNSLKIIIEEKSKKIASFRTDYKTWWLILVDFIGYGVSENELKESIPLVDKNVFERIYFISPIDKTIGIFI